MADTKISALPSTTTVNGNESIPLVQSGVTKRVTPDVLIRDSLTTALVEGDNITISQDVSTGVMTISSTGGGGTSLVDSVNGKTGVVVLTASDVGAAAASHTQAISTITGLQTALDGKETSGTASAAVTAHVAATDPHTQYLSKTSAASTYVPVTTTVNGKALSSNISLTNTDVGAAATVHTQDSTTITDFTEAVQDVMGSTLVAGSNMNIVYDDTANTITLSATTGGTSAVTSVNSKTGAVVLTASDVGALSSSDIGVSVQGYNSGTVVDSSYVHTDNNYTTAEKSKLAGIAAGAQVNTVTSVNTKTGAVSLVASDVGALATSALGTTVQPYDLYTVVDPAYVHTDNNYTSTEKTKLSGIETGAQVNTVNSVNSRTGNVVLSNTDVGAQAYNGDLTAIAGLSGTSGLLRKTNTNAWSLDTETYLTGNQLIVLSGDIAGSGTTNINTVMANSGVTAGTYNNSATAITPFTVSVKGTVTATGSPVTITPAFSSITSTPTTVSGYGITDAVTLTGSQTLTNKTLTSPIVNGGTITGATVSTSKFADLTITNSTATGTVTLDYSTANTFNLTLTGNTTLALSNIPTPSGQTYYIVVKVTQGATAYTLTWWSNITWLTSGGTAPSAPSASKVIEYIFSTTDGTNWVGRKGAYT